MGKQAESIIRETFQKLGDTLGIQIDIQDETIADLAATLQTDIDRIGNLTTELAKAMMVSALERTEAWEECSSSRYRFLAYARDALAHLTSTGRLVPAGGMALTAEQVEDVEALVATANPYSAPAARLRALFPATEPAEERCQSVSIFRERCALVSGHDGRHAGNGCAWGRPPVPAEPAEEETKAEVFEAALHAGMDEMRWEIDEKGGEVFESAKKAILAALFKFSLDASSPVVPAPAETGPWETWQEVPEGVKYKSRADRHPHAPVWINQGGNRLTQLHSGEWAQSALTGDGYSCFAPFVAAEEG